MIGNVPKGTFDEPEQVVHPPAPAPELPEDNLLLDLLLDNPWVVEPPMNGEVNGVMNGDLHDMPDPDEEAAIIIAPIEEDVPEMPAPDDPDEDVPIEQEGAAGQVAPVEDQEGQEEEGVDG